ncbi:MFS general substrate transporter [Dacryopinax primogenitus]|uniref:MFS general substrate transporter n=1 Tax=Dacryopinax primogenitus (strain DJM 731) TaxID=1858805 RepID=M5G0R4_DACPD|nr:MFS general substrate transporter [Dacryopinax primogenitus]EJU02339.1 MFS general substrate transporter [Dacryopinax primogenitus]
MTTSGQVQEPEKESPTLLQQGQLQLEQGDSIQERKLSRLQETSHFPALEHHLQEDDRDALSLQIPLEPQDLLPNGDAIPDGGYGWVVCLCQFFINTCTWGPITSFGVFLSFYRVNDFFPGANDIEYAFVAGLALSLPLFVSPLSNYLTSRLGLKVPMCIGVILQVLGLVFAGLSTKIWQIFLTQSGTAIGLVWLPTLPVLAQWFSKHRALALGIATSGSGGGSLFFSLVTRATIQRLGLRWAFIINAFVTLVVLTPSVLLMRVRTETHVTMFRFRDLHWFAHKGFSWVLLWTFTILLGSTIAVVSVPTYATAGLGLTQAQGASLQAIMAASQIVGRPLTGLFLDRVGRINGTAIITLLGDLSCLVIWMFARNFGLLVFFCIVQGMTGGIFWAACGPVCAEVVGLGEMATGRALLCLVGAVPCLVSEAIGIALVDYSETALHLTGAQAYTICIGFSGGAFGVAAMVLLGAKWHMQGNWRVWERA